MSSRLQPYSLYKPSGVPWLGDVPVYWDVPSLKHVCSRYALYGANVSATKYLQSGIRFLRTSDITDTGNLNEDGVFLPEATVRDYMLNDGDILLSRSGTVGRSFLYQSNLHGPCSYAGYLVRFIPGERVIPKYIFFFTKTASFEEFLRSVAISSTIENVNANKYSAAKLPLPPLSEQKSIVIHLSKLTYRIDSLIEKLQRKIELLKEHRTALISQCVTKGLNPNAEMKDSGVEWIGNIPSHWKEKKVKHSCDVTLGKMLTPQNKGDMKKKPYLRSQNVQNGYFDLNDVKEMWFSDSELVNLELRYDDLLISEGGQVGRSALWDESIVPCYFQNSLNRIRSESVNTKFLSYLFELYFSKGYFDSVVDRVSIPHLTKEKLSEIKLVEPPLHEQTLISKLLDQKTSQIDYLSEKLQRKIEILKEYRHSLISNVVTGKVKVTEEAL